MAEGFLKAFDNFIDVYSAGTKPEDNVNPYAVKVMQEVGIDISKNKPETVEKYINERQRKCKFP